MMTRERRSTVMLTGNTGYIGSVMMHYLKQRSYKVVGFDSDWFRRKDFFKATVSPDKQIFKDIRDIAADDLDGIGAVIHLAGLSNDPLGEINPGLTEDINYKATLRLAELCKTKGIERFIFSSSCSMYGISLSDAPITEEGKLNPITAYAKAKVLSEEALSRLADGRFHPTYMRNATVYGVSPRLRLDLVVNNLAAWTYLTGEIAIMSDGTPWRPIVHVEDVCRAFTAVLEAPVDLIHDQAFNVGTNEGNYQVRGIAEMIREQIPSARVKILNTAGPDERTYRVDFTKIKNALPSFTAEWDLKRGIAELLDAYKRYGLVKADFDSDKYFRIRTIKKLLEKKMMDNNLELIGGAL